MPGFAGGMGGVLGESVLKLSTDSKPLEKGLKSAEDKARVAGAKMGKALHTGLAKNADKLKSIGTKLTLGLSLEIAGVAAGVVAASSKFETGMNKVQAVSGATAAEMKQLSELAKDLGATTKFSASEAAEGMSFLSMAGFAANETIAAMPGLLSLAAAGGLELGEAADIASNVLSGFGENADQAGRTADILAYTAANANTSVSQLGEAMSYVAPVAASVGLTMEETAAMIGKLGDAGIQSTRAGTALRGMIAQLLEPSESGAKALKHLGVVTHDAAGRMRPLGDILRELGRAGMDAQQAMAIFGRIAAPAGLVLAQTAEQTKQLASELYDSAGAADEMSSVMMRGLSGAWTEFKSATEGLFIAIGESGLTGALESLIDKTTIVIRWMGSWSKTTLAVTTVIAGLAAAAGPLLIGLGALGAVLPGLVGGLGLVVAKIKLWTSAQWLLNTAMSANPIGLVITAVSALIALALPVWLSTSAEKARLLGGAMREITGSATDNTAQKIKKLNTLLEEQSEQLKGVEAQIAKAKGGHYKRQLEHRAEALREHIKRTSAAIRVQEFNQRREARDTAREKAEAAKSGADAQIKSAAETARQIVQYANESHAAWLASTTDAWKKRIQAEKAGLESLRGVRDLFGDLHGGAYDKSRAENERLARHRNALEMAGIGSLGEMRKLTVEELAHLPPGDEVKLREAGQKAGGALGRGLSRALGNSMDLAVGRLITGRGSFAVRLKDAWRSVGQDLQNTLIRHVGGSIRHLHKAMGVFIGRAVSGLRWLGNKGLRVLMFGRYGVIKIAHGFRGLGRYIVRMFGALAKLPWGKVFKGLMTAARAVGEAIGEIWDVIKAIGSWLGSGLQAVGSSIWAGLEAIWVKFLSPAGEAIWAGLKAIWTRFLSPAGEAIWSIVRGAWENFLKPVGEAIWSVIKLAWDKFLRPVGKALWAVIKWAWDAFLRPVGTALWKALKWAWDTFLRPVGEAMWKAIKFVWDTFLRPIGKALWAVLTDAWDAFLRPVGEAMWSVLKPVWDHILRPVGKTMWEILKPIWTKFLKPVGSALADLFGIGGKAGKSATDVILGQGLPSASDLPDFPGAGGGTTGAGGAASGVAKVLAGTVTAITSAVSAVTDVIGAFQAHGRGKDLENIAEHMNLISRGLGFRFHPGHEDYNPADKVTKRSVKADIAGSPYESGAFEDSIHGNTKQTAEVITMMDARVSALLGTVRPWFMGQTNENVTGSLFKLAERAQAYLGATHTLDSIQETTALHREEVLARAASIDERLAGLQTVVPAELLETRTAVINSGQSLQSSITAAATSIQGTISSAAGSISSAIRSIDVRPVVNVNVTRVSSSRSSSREKPEGLADGTDYVSRGGLFDLHRGEAVLNERDNERLSRIDRMAANIQEGSAGRRDRPIKLSLELEVDDSRRLHVKNLRKNGEFGDAVIDVVQSGVKTNKRGIRRSLGDLRPVRGTA